MVYCFLSFVQILTTTSPFNIFTFPKQSEGKKKEKNWILLCKSPKFFRFILSNSDVTKKLVFELILSLNVSGNLGPKRIAGALKQKIVHMIHVTAINLRRQLIREASLWIAAWKTDLVKREILTSKREGRVGAYGDSQIMHLIFFFFAIK